MSELRVAFLGYGNVGAAIASAVARAGHDVVLAVNPERPDGAALAVAAHPDLAGATVAPAAEAVAAADVVVLAVPFAGLDALLPPLADALEGTVVVDATNPVGPGLTHGLGSSRSGAQHVAELVPGARVVKAFNVYGYENLSDPPTGPDGLRAVMPYAGDDVDAKAVVGGLLDGLGWEPLDVGPLAAAVDLEHMTLLWVRLVRVLGHDPRLVWAALGDR
ncbi:MAG: NADPH-dependent F420 reductase [Microthrixaceae bacterium]